MCNVLYKERNGSTDANVQLMYTRRDSGLYHVYAWGIRSIFKHKQHVLLPYKEVESLSVMYKFNLTVPPQRNIKAWLGEEGKTKMHEGVREEKHQETIAVMMRVRWQINGESPIVLLCNVCFSPMSDRWYIINRNLLANVTGVASVIQQLWGNHNFQIYEQSR